jgi:hypothetical protein
MLVWDDELIVSSNIPVCPFGTSISIQTSSQLRAPVSSAISFHSSLLQTIVQPEKHEWYSHGDTQAQAPTRLIKKAPANTNRHATTLLFPLSTCQLWSLKKSSDMSSTRLANTRNPADTAFMMPTTRSPTSESGEYKV